MAALDRLAADPPSLAALAGWMWVSAAQRPLARTASASLLLFRKPPSPSSPSPPPLQDLAGDASAEPLAMALLRLLERLPLQPAQLAAAAGEAAAARPGAPTSQAAALAALLAAVQAAGASGRGKDVRARAARLVAQWDRAGGARGGAKGCLLSAPSGALMLSAHGAPFPHPRSHLGGRRA